MTHRGGRNALQKKDTRPRKAGSDGTTACSVKVLQLGNAVKWKPPVEAETRMGKRKAMYRRERGSLEGHNEEAEV